MKQITAEEFKAAVRLDPAWAATLTEPVEVRGYCEMMQSPITHLSPLLHFTGRNQDGEAADFSYCPKLQVAEGNFAGRVRFAYSGITKIGELIITMPDKDNTAADFSECKNLKVAEGTFHGLAEFSGSRIEKIGRLTITQSNKNGWAAYFNDCPNLKVAEGTFPGAVDFNNAGIKTIGKLTITATNKTGFKASFKECQLRLPAELLGPEYLMDDTTRQENLRRINNGKAVVSALKTAPNLEI